MLLHLPPMADRDGPRVKNGPALAGHGAEAVRDAIADAITTLPEQLRRSLTWDQGAEMAQHAQLRIETGLPVYFCDPHSPWQRGTNENTNGCCASTSRRAPTSSRHSAEDLAAVAAALNSRPRKTLELENARRGAERAPGDDGLNWHGCHPTARPRTDGAHAAIAAPARPRATLRDDSRVTPVGRIRQRELGHFTPSCGPSEAILPAPTIPRINQCCEDRLSLSWQP